MKVALVGYMGCGKTTIGSLLADVWKARFIDTDEAVEEKAGKPIASIFAESGEEHFRALEYEVISAALEDDSKLVLSTGGGAPCYSNTMSKLLSTCFVVYLECDAETLFYRGQHALHKRPLQRRTLTELKEHLKERQEIYHKAHLKVDANKDVNAVITSIQTGLKLYTS